MKDEQNDLEIIFNNIEEECAYYKSEYSKLQFKSSQLKKENIKLKEDNKKIIENLNKERKGKKELEEKEKYSNVYNPSRTFALKNDESIFDKLFFDSEDEEFFEQNEDLIINNNLNIINEINVDHSNNIDQINEPQKSDDKKNKKSKNKKDKKNKNKEEQNINKKDEINEIIENDKAINDIQINNNINNFKENTGKISFSFNNIKNINENLKDATTNKIINNEDDKKELENKLEEPKINEEELLLKDLIKYEKDSISYRKLLLSNELKLSKIYLLLRKWRHYLENLKKGALYFNKSITMFNECLAKYNNNDNILKKEFPFLFEQISILQKCFSTINIYCSSLITTIDSSCSIQINHIIKDFFKELIKLKGEIYKKNNEFLLIQNKYLTTKTHKKESNSLKEKYYNEYKIIEEMKYDYCCMINKILLITKLKMPEIICLLAYSYGIFFINIKNEIEQLNILVRKNLEDIISKVKTQHKIESDMTKNKNEILENLINNVNNTIKNKEGFLNIKDNNSNKFVKRYIKILNGNLVYYKLIKVYPNEESNNLDNSKHINQIEKIDTNNYFEICNLLLSNVKKIIKPHSYPFCFEINNVNLKKPYIFQAETEKEMEEWIISISNAISEQISGFDEKKEKQKKEGEEFVIINDPENNFNIIYKSSPVKENSSEINQINAQNEKKKKLEKLINENVCADCGAIKPTWLSTNWLTMICIDCSSFHRSLGVQISKIKSLELDNILDEYIEILSVIKQNDINNILEERIIDYDKEKPKFNSSREEKEEFIINKYREKKLMNLKNEDENKVISDIFLSIEKNDFLNIYKLIKLNTIDINKIYHFNNEEYGFIHHCIKCNNLFCFKLLYIFGADINLIDNNGKKPIEILDKEKQSDFCKYLDEKNK